MAKFVLECPKCEARFNLRKHVPGRRVRCRKCRAIVIIPNEDGTVPEFGDGKRRVDPELRKKLAAIFSVRKLALIAVLLAVALVGGAFILIQQYRTQRKVMAEEEEPGPREITPEIWARMNARVPYPLGAGFEWSYRLEGGGEHKRRVTNTSRGPGGEPQFDLTLTGVGRSRTLMLRVLPDGVYVIYEKIGVQRYDFDPPMLLVPLPLYLDSEWYYKGDYVLEGGAAETWDLKFRCQPTPPVTTVGGTRPAYQVFCSGVRGENQVAESTWYCVGVGVVKFEKILGAERVVGELASFNAAPKPAEIPEDLKPEEPPEDPNGLPPWQSPHEDD